MEEVLFRGKRIDNGEWIEGYYAAEPYMKSTYNYGYILENEKDLYAKKAYLVDSRTVGQFTGLTDKNGKKIFEGDIIKICGQHSCFDKVEFLDGLAGFYAVNDDIHIPTELATLKKNFIEVIGNIYDNKDLIGESV